MPSTPVPRSYNAILGDMVDAFLSRFGIPSLKVGSPVLSILEAASQSDLRSSQDIFQMLAAVDLDSAEGVALDRWGASEDVARPGDLAATGTVTVGDSSFTKVSTTVYQGQPAPVAGATTIYVVDASAWTTPGPGTSIYLGRGTTHLEGPIVYTVLVDNGSYWTVTLATPTGFYHDRGESVTLAQGGDRVVAAGSLCQTPQANAATAVQFRTLFAATVPDGETEIAGVQVVAQRPGATGNVPAGAISAWVSAPFSGATVTNPRGFVTGQSRYDDNAYRELIRLRRRSRSRGTAVALTTAVLGVEAEDESKRVLSASVVSQQGQPTVLYVDDGTGYEETSAGVALETLIDEALGGEQYFQLAQARPVAKAALTSTLTAPFALVDGSRLAVLVDGELQEHGFTAAEFRAIGVATAYEVVASINADTAIGFSARTAGGGTEVVIFSRADVNEDLQVTTPAAGVDANTYLGFPAQRADTLRLYRNDVLLYKDGRRAQLESEIQSSWGVLVSGDTLTVAIDGTAARTYTVTDADFVAADTGYATVSASNSLASWAAVLEYLVPGLGAQAGSGVLLLSSNAGADSRAQVVISGGTLVSKGVFRAQTVTGRTSDYTLNRNTAQLGLTTVLAAGDSLTAGSRSTRAFIETPDLTSAGLTLGATANFWFCVDGGAAIVPIGVTAVTALAWSNVEAITGGRRIRITAPTAAFTEVLRGDWVLVRDPAVTANNRGQWAVADVDPLGFWLDIERPAAAFTVESVVMSSTGITVVRSQTQPQKLAIVAGTYTAADLADLVTAGLIGATGETSRTTRLRVRTNSYSGDIALVDADTEAQALGLPVADAVSSLDSHVAALESGHGETGTPGFWTSTIAAATSSTQIDLASVSGYTQGSLAVGRRDRPDTATYSRWGGASQYHSALERISGVTLYLRQAAAQEWLVGDRLYPASPFAIGPEDDLAVVLDQDQVTRQYNPNLYRRADPSGAYGGSVTLLDADNSSATFPTAFGSAFAWADFAVNMKARRKSHPGAPDTNKTALWRYYRHGSEGEAARVAYGYPLLASQATAVRTDALTSTYLNVEVVLPTAASRAGYTVRNTTRIGVGQAAVAGGLYPFTYAVGFAISTATKVAGVTTVTLTLPAGITDHGLQIGDQIWINSGDVNYGSGLYTLTNRAATTVTYTDTVPGAAGPTPNIGTLSADTVGEAILTGGGILVGDLAVVAATGTGVLPANAGYVGRAVQILTLADQHWQGSSLATGAGSTVLTWFALNDPAYLDFFPIDSASNQMGQLVTAVNALAAAAGSTVPITGVAVGDGAGDDTGVIGSASYEASELGGTDPWYYLTDGLNWVRSYAAPSTFVLKAAVTAELTTNSDWGNEDVRLTPTTAQNVVDWLNSSATSGLAQGAEVARVQAGGHVGLSTATLGSAGAVQVQGGTGQSLQAALLGSTAVVATTTSLSQGRTSDLAGLRGGHWVALQNSIGAQRAVFDALTDLDHVTLGSDFAAIGGGDFVLDGGGTPAYTVSQAAQRGYNWQVERHGDFVALVHDGLSAAPPTISGAEEGDYVVIESPAPVSFDVLSANNVGNVTTLTLNQAHEFRVGSQVDVQVLAPFSSGIKAVTAVGANTISYAETSPVAGSTTGTAAWAQPLNSLNAGTFRVVRLQTDGTNRVLWIENPNAVEELAAAHLLCLEEDSLFPGDVLTFGADTWDADNMGTWTVEDVGRARSQASLGNVNQNIGGTLVTVDTVAPHGFATGDWVELITGESSFPAGLKRVTNTGASQFTYVEVGTPSASSSSDLDFVGAPWQTDAWFRVDTAGGSPVNASGPLGADSPLFICTEGEPSRLIKQVLCLSPNPDDATVTDIKWTSATGYRWAGAAQGTVIEALDKLDFSVDLQVGQDAYRHSTGLIAAANRVAYGDSEDPDTYPGIVASGAQVNISGPLVRRIQASLAIRVQTGVDRDRVEAQVRAEVSDVINRTGVGQAIALATLVTAAQAVNGVVAVTLLSPSYGPGSDLLAVQSNEKPLVLDPDVDISVSFV